MFFMSILTKQAYYITKEPPAFVKSEKNKIKYLLFSYQQPIFATVFHGFRIVLAKSFLRLVASCTNLFCILLHLKC